MGTFGPEPRDNDTALDHELHIFGCEGRDDIGPQREDEQREDEQRYVAWLVTQLKPDFPNIKDHAVRSLERMEALLENDEWLSTWDDRREVQTAIGKQIAELRKLVV